MRCNALIDVNEIAAGLAKATDEEQAKFFNVFVEELVKQCETHYATEMQLHYCNKYLTDNSKEYLKCLGMTNK